MSFHEKLFTPGPTEVRSELLQALSTPQIHHRSEEFSQLYDRVQQKLQELLYTDNPVFLYSSSSTGAMESAVTNGVEKRCLNLVNGAFGDRWHRITKRNGVPCDKVELEWGKAIKPELVEEEVSSGDYDAITLVFNETSTGMMNPLREIAQVMEKYEDVLLLVDAVSGMAGAQIKFDDWGLDMCLAGAQKAFSLPAGLSVAAVSEKMLERAEEVPNRSYYFNLPLYLKYHKRSQTRSTPAIPQIFALHEALDHIVNEEGVQERFDRHEKLANIVQEWAQRNFDIFPEEGYWSQTLTCVENTRGISVAELNETLQKDYGARISNGYGDLKEETFRIAHMGDVSEIEIRGLLATIDSILGL